jgi:phosphoketolase
MQTPVLVPEVLARINAYWRAASYLSVGQIYLYVNALLKRPLKQTDVKPLVVGHWGTTPGQNFIYVHLNRVIKKCDLDMFYVAGPGHGGPALVGNTEHKVYINQHGEDMAEIRNWKWSGNTKGGAKTIKPRAELETAHDG